MNIDMEQDIDLSSEAGKSTVSKFAVAISWVSLFALAVVTGIHAINLAMEYTNYSGGFFAGILITSVILCEVFAVSIGALLALNILRAKQKPLAMAVELAWIVFAGMNLIASFTVEHRGETPNFVSNWIAFGLPISMLIIGVLFYMTLRFDPRAQRADDQAELQEKFLHVQHKATLEVLGSRQMSAVIRQMKWQQLPAIIGRQLGLTDDQISSLQSQAPALLDLNNNGKPDIYESAAPEIVAVSAENKVNP